MFVAASGRLWVEVEQAGEDIDDEVAAVEVHLEFELGNDDTCTAESVELVT